LVHKNYVSVQELAGQAIDADQLERQYLILIFSFNVALILQDKPSIITDQPEFEHLTPL
jgi:hypothetical protein